MIDNSTIPRLCALALMFVLSGSVGLWPTAMATEVPQNQAGDPEPLQAPVALRMDTTLSVDRIGTGAAPSGPQPVVRPPSPSADASRLTQYVAAAVLVALLVGLGVGRSLPRTDNRALREARQTVAELEAAESRSGASAGTNSDADSSGASERQAEQLAGELATSAERIAALEAELSALRTAAEEDDTQQRIAAVEQERQDARESEQAAQSSLSALTDQFETLGNALAEREHAIEALREQLATAENARDDAQQAAERKLSDWQSTVNTLEADLRERTRLLDERTDELHASFRDYTEVREGVAAHERVVASMEQTLVERANVIEALERAAATADERQQELGAELQASQSRIAELEAAAASAEDSQAGLSAELQAAQEAGSRLDSELQGALASIQDLTQQLDDSQVRSGELNAEVAQLKQDNHTLKQLGVEANAARDSDAQQLAAQAEELDAARELAAELAESKAALKLARGALEAAQADAAESERLRAAGASEIERLGASLQEQQQALAALEATAHDRERALAEALETAAADRQQLHQLSREADDLNTVAAQARADLEAARADQAQGAEALAHAEEALAGTRSQLAEIEQALNEEQRRAAGSEQAAQVAAELQEAVDARDQQLASLREQLSNSQERAIAAEAAAEQAAAELGAARTGMETGTFQFNARLEEAMQLTAALEQRSLDAEARVEQLQAQLDDVRQAAESRLATVTRENAEELEAMSATAAEREAEVQRLSNEVTLWQERGERAAREAQEAAATRAAQDQSQADEQISALTDELAVMRAERDGLRRDLDAAVADASEEAAALRASIAALHSSVEPATGAESDAERQALEHEAESLQAELAEARTAIETLRETVSSQESQRNKSTLRFKQSEARLAEVSTEREAQVQTIRSLRSRNKVLEEKSREIQASLAGRPLDVLRTNVPEASGDEDPAERLAQIEPLFQELTSANRLLVTKQVAMQATLSNHSGELKKRAVLIDRLKQKLIAAQKKEKAAASESDASDAAKKELLEYRNRVRELEAKLSDHGSRYRSLEQARDQWQQHAAALKRAMEDREKQPQTTDEINKEVLKLKEEVASRDEQIADITVGLAERDEALQTVRAQSKSWMSRVAPLVSALKERDELIARLETGGDAGEAADAGASLVPASLVAEREAEIGDLRSRLDEQTRATSEMERQVEALAKTTQSAREQHEEVERLRAELQARGDLITELENDTCRLADISEALEQRDNRIAALEASLQGGGANAPDERSGEADRVVELERTIAELRTEADANRRRAADLETILRDQEGTVDYAAATGEQEVLGEVALLRDEVAAQAVLIDNLEADLVFWKRRAKATEGSEA